MLSRSSPPDPSSCKTSGGFLPFSLKCSLLMTHPQSYKRTHTSSVFYWDRANHTYADVWLDGDFIAACLADQMLCIFCISWRDYLLICLFSGLSDRPGSAQRSTLREHTAAQLRLCIPASLYVDAFRISFTTSAAKSASTCNLFSSRRIYAFHMRSGQRGLGLLLMAHILNSCSWPPAASLPLCQRKHYFCTDKSTEEHDRLMKGAANLARAEALLLMMETLT